MGEFGLQVEFASADNATETGYLPFIGALHDPAGPKVGEGLFPLYSSMLTKIWAAGDHTLACQQKGLREIGKRGDPTIE